MPLAQTWSLHFAMAMYLAPAVMVWFAAWSDNSPNPLFPATVICFWMLNFKSLLFSGVNMIGGVAQSIAKTLILAPLILQCSKPASQSYYSTTINPECSPNIDSFRAIIAGLWIMAFGQAVIFGASIASLCSRRQSSNSPTVKPE